MKKRTCNWVLLLLAVAVVFGLTPSVHAAKYVIRAATVLVEDSPAAKCLHMFGDIVESETWGEIEVEVFAGGKLGAERETIEGAQMNNVHLTIPSVGVLANFAKEMRVLNIPFLLSDRRVAHGVLVESDIKNKLLAPLEKVGLVGLSFGDYGMRNLTSKKPVKSLADIKGMKVRTMKVPDHLALWKTLGANPTPIAFTELYGALQQGVVDGQENPWETIYLSKFYEVQNHVAVTGHIYDVQPLVMSKRFYDGLSEENQKIIRHAAEVATQYMWYITAKQNDMFKQKCLDEGLKVYNFTDEQIQEAREKTKSVTEKIREVVGEDLVNEYISAVKKVEQSMK
jgi:tripartite ATP-independent transporter DctP family solute receptor